MGVLTAPVLAGVRVVPELVQVNFYSGTLFGEYLESDGVVRSEEW